MIETFKIKNFDETVDQDLQQQAVSALEEGKVLFFPELSFQINSDELNLLNSSLVNPKTKNISYNTHSDCLQGTICFQEDFQNLKNLVSRFSRHANDFLVNLCANYLPGIQQGRTSFRPAEIEGRFASKKKDDTRLHVDAFPSSPTGGKRILRLFTNINNTGRPRVWRIGTTFDKVVDHFLPKIGKPMLGSSTLMHALKITKERRTFYDHYMLKLHNAMKFDEDYQKNVTQLEFHFPAGSTWMCFTDQVSHAAMSGQHVLEQTFYLPVSAMANEQLAPLRVLERSLGQNLV